MIVLFFDIFKISFLTPFGFTLSTSFDAKELACPTRQRDKIKLEF